MNTKINIAKLFLSTLLVQVMCLSVVLSHMHAKDAVSVSTQHSSANKLVPIDITAKALGDLHHHIDKASLKNITGDQGSTTAARVRELNPLDAKTTDDSLMGQLRDFMLRLRMVASLFYQLA